MPEIDLNAEIARLQEELMFFRTECLPAFLKLVPEGDRFPDQVRKPSANQISQWQSATGRLTEMLPIGLSENEPTLLRSEEYAQFMREQGEPSYTYRNERIIWNISLFPVLGMARHWCPDVLQVWPESVEEVRAALVANIDRVKRWLLSQPVADSGLHNSLCMVLPSLADVDPLFAALALDPETWKSVARTDPELTNQEKAERLKLIEVGVFPHVLNNALLHVLGALANNHFMTIRDFLDHPHLNGHYTGLMPHYLFAVLFSKVKTLRTLAGIEAGDEPDLVKRDKA